MKKMMLLLSCACAIVLGAFAGEDEVTVKVSVAGTVNNSALKKQCEVKGKLFQQALQDIDKAATMAPREPLYLAEKASLQLRVNMKEEALATAQQAIDLDPEYDEAYLLKGLALIQTGKKKEGLAAFEKAKDLGNEQAASLIEKYK